MIKSKIAAHNMTNACVELKPMMLLGQPGGGPTVEGDTSLNAERRYTSTRSCVSEAYVTT